MEPAPAASPHGPADPTDSQRASAARYKLTVCYRGTAYHGWQRQLLCGDDTGAVELPTVQNNLRLAIERVVGHPVLLVGSSRTDAGVHALGQIAHFDTIRTQIPPARLMTAINARLPADIAVQNIEPVPADFDAIGWTVAKGYRYVIHNSPTRDVFASDLAWHLPKPLDLEAMARAASAFVGEHDFTAFVKIGHGRESTIRRITDAGVRREGERIIFETAGEGFLWHQVRIMAGTLVEVGLGRRGPGIVAEALESGDRRLAGPTAPPHGLCLMWVRTRLDGQPPQAGALRDA